MSNFRSQQRDATDAAVVQLTAKILQIDPHDQHNAQLASAVASSLEKLKYHKFLDADRTTIRRNIEGLIEKLTFQNLVSRADKLGQSFSQFERILNQKNGSSVFKNPDAGYAIIQCLLSLSENPVAADIGEARSSSVAKPKDVKSSDDTLKAELQHNAKRHMSLWTSTFEESDSDSDIDQSDTEGEDRALVVANTSTVSRSNKNTPMKVKNETKTESPLKETQDAWADFSLQLDAPAALHSQSPPSTLSTSAMSELLSYHTLPEIFNTRFTGSKISNTTAHATSLMSDSKWPAWSDVSKTSQHLAVSISAFDSQPDSPSETDNFWSLPLNSSKLRQQIENSHIKTIERQQRESELMQKHGMASTSITPTSTSLPAATVFHSETTGMQPTDIEYAKVEQETELIKQIMCALQGNVSSVFGIQHEQFVWRRDALHAAPLPHLSTSALRFLMEPFLSLASQHLMLQRACERALATPVNQSRPRGNLCYQHLARFISERLRHFQRGVCKLWLLLDGRQLNNDEARDEFIDVAAFSGTLMSLNEVLWFWLAELRELSDFVMLLKQNDSNCPFDDSHLHHGTSSILLSSLHRHLTMAALQGPDGAGELFANMWLTASQPYWQMLSAWLYTGQFVDPYQEFMIVDHNVDKQTTPLLSWSKSFSFRSKSEAPLSDAKITTDSLIPTFLHKSAARIMSIGKSTRLLLLFEQQRKEYRFSALLPRFLSQYMHSSDRAQSDFDVQLLPSQRLLHAFYARIAQFDQNVLRNVSKDASHVQLEIDMLPEPAAISVSDLFSSSLEHIFVQHEHALNQILNRVLLAGHTTAPPSKNPDVSFNEITFVNSATASSALNTPQFTAVQHALFPPAALNELALPSVTDSDFVITTSHASQNTLLRFISLFRSFFLQERADLMSGFVESFFDQLQNKDRRWTHSAVLSEMLRDSISSSALSVCFEVSSQHSTAHSADTVCLSVSVHSLKTSPSEVHDKQRAQLLQTLLSDEPFSNDVDALELLKFQASIAWPSRMFFENGQTELYSDVLIMLLQISRTRALLSESRFEFAQTQRMLPSSLSHMQCIKPDEPRSHLFGLKRRMADFPALLCSTQRDALSLSHHLTHFVSVLHNHVLQRIVDFEWRRLCDNIHNMRGGVDQLIDIHNEYIESIARHALLLPRRSPQLAALRSAVKQILNIGCRLSALMQGSLLVLLQQQQPIKGQSIEIDSIMLDRLDTIVATLSALRTDFAQRHRFVFRALQQLTNGSLDVASNSFVEILSRLDYNAHYRHAYDVGVRSGSDV